MGELLKDMSNLMEKQMCLVPDDQDEQDPTVQLWLYYYLSKHNLNLEKIEEALEYINKAINHTPTVVDLYILKAKIIQKAGN